MLKQESTAHPKLTHMDAEGRAYMVDVSAKQPSMRIAVARGWVRMSAETLRLIENREVKKGDVLAVAQVAAIMAAKRTPDIIPMCHQLIISGVEVRFCLNFKQNRVEIEATVRTSSRTGVEIEALTAVAVAGLTIYDMCKSADRGMVVGDVRLVMKRGGKSGVFARDGEEEWGK